jgi:hypothetical protein
VIKMRFILALLTLLSVVRPVEAWATNPSPCVSVVPVTIAGSVDPFSPAGSSNTVTLTVRRPPTPPSSPKTQSAWLWFTRSSSTPAGLNIQTISGGNLLRNVTEFPVFNDPVALEIDFQGVAQPETQGVTVTIQLIFSPGTDLSAGLVTYTLGYNAYCKNTGGGAVSGTESGSSGLAVSLNVLSGLQAGIGGLTATTGSIPLGELGLANTTGRTGFVNVRVRSSGPYSFQIGSLKGWCLTAGAANCASTPTVGKINYNARFGSQSVNEALPGVQFNCQRAGVAAAGLDIPLSVITEESGQFKSPSTAYADEMTITLAPLTVPVAQVAC